MVLADKKAMVIAMVDNDSEATDTLVTMLLTRAENAILRRMYPMAFPDDPEIPTEYEVLQCELAARYFFRRGGEGEKAHSENGVSRTYADVHDEDLLADVMQVVTMR